MTRIKYSRVSVFNVVYHLRAMKQRHMSLDSSGFSWAFPLWDPVFELYIYVDTCLSSSETVTPGKKVERGLSNPGSQ